MSAFFDFNKFDLNISPATNALVTNYRPYLRQHP